jgi:hypothetical protein
MKTAAFILLCFLCSAVTVAQDINLTGTWTMFEMTYASGQEKNTMTEDQMKAEGAVTDLFLMDEGKLKQTSNMSGSGTMDTYEGTWKFADNHLIISLKVGERLMDIVWDFEFKDNVMKLSRTAPDGSMTIINSFRKKSA